MTKRLALIASTFVVVALAAVPTAGAAVTIGSDLTRTPFESSFCPAKCSWTQTALTGRNARAPQSGVLVRWRIKTDGPSGPIAIRVMRPGAGTELTGIATGADVTASAAGISVFPVRIPIQAGDALGIDFDSTNTAGIKPDGPGEVDNVALYHTPNLLDGTTLPAFAVNTGTELLLNGDIESDTDQDGFGDESQDLCPGTSGQINGCVALAPALKLTVAKRQSIRRLAATVSLDRVGSVQARATVSYKLRGKRVTLSTKLVKSSLATLTNRKLKFAFTRAQRAKIGTQLKRGRKLSAKLRFVARDTVGSSSNSSRTVRLKR